MPKVNCRITGLQRLSSVSQMAAIVFAIIWLDEGFVYIRFSALGVVCYPTLLSLCTYDVRQSVCDDREKSMVSKTAQ